MTGSVQRSPNLASLADRRKFKSWVDAFYLHTEKMGSPPLFRKWAAIFAVGAAMERKIWVKTAKGVLYPNLYAVIVGPPGAGKTLGTALAHDMLNKLEGHHIAPTSVTRASLIDALNGAERRIIRPMETPSITMFNSLTVLSDELGVFIPSYENDFMSVLTTLYDCRLYSEERRTKDLKLKMNAPQLSLIAATTPSYLNNLIPEGAWDQGFMSRVLMLYSGASEPTNLFEENKNDERTFDALVHDLKLIGDLWGQVTFESSAADLFIQWHMTGVDGGAPIPDHPRLSHYNKRRSAHLLKLCMIACASCGDTKRVTDEHFVEALDWLVEAEGMMPDIFKSMTMGSANRVIDDTYHHVYTLYMKEKMKPIAEHRIIAFIRERVPIHDVMRVLEVMTRSGLLEEKIVDFTGRAFIPKGR
jgi:hypothetical protein